MVFFLVWRVLVFVCDVGLMGVPGICGLLGFFCVCVFVWHEMSDSEFCNIYAANVHIVCGIFHNKQMSEILKTLRRGIVTDFRNDASIVISIDCDEEQPLPKNVRGHGTQLERRAHGTQENIIILYADSSFRWQCCRG